MSLDPWTSEAAHRTRRTLYRLAGFYMVLGLLVAVLAMLARDLLSTFLGCLIVGGTIAASVALDSLLRLTHTTLSMLEEVRDRLATLESTSSGTIFEMSEEDVDSTTIDVAAGAWHDPSMISAGSLEGSKFPRLVAGFVDVDEPYDGQEADPPTSSGRAASHWDHAARAAEATDTPGWVSPTANSDRMRQWRVALHRGDLAACRAAYDRLVPHVSTVAAESLETTLRNLELETEQKLRQQFASQIRTGMYSEAIETGDMIVRYFPAGRAAADFKRLRDVLTDRITTQDPSVYAEAQ